MKEKQVKRREEGVEKKRSMAEAVSLLSLTFMSVFKMRLFFCVPALGAFCFRSFVSCLKRS